MKIFSGEKTLTSPLPSLKCQVLLKDSAPKVTAKPETPRSSLGGKRGLEVHTSAPAWACARSLSGSAAPWAVKETLSPG